MMSCPKLGVATALDQSGLRPSPEVVEQILKRFTNVGRVDEAIEIIKDMEFNGERWRCCWNWFGIRLWDSIEEASHWPFFPYHHSRRSFFSPSGKNDHTHRKTETIWKTNYHLLISLHSIRHGIRIWSSRVPNQWSLRDGTKKMPRFYLQAVNFLGQHRHVSFMEHLSNKYYLIAKNCNHFTNEVSMRLTGKPIPGLAKLAVRHLPDHATISDEDSDSGDSSLTMGSEEDEVDNHHLLNESNSDVAFLQETPFYAFLGMSWHQQSSSPIENIWDNDVAPSNDEKKAGLTAAILVIGSRLMRSSTR
ncbi:hypothetical protein L2E82_40793 [Cichorium intybus]|uniref:Uncharacterized protein n=1 Tax=Cichorium intybus TaxID=13427 RepID=A0ACB9ALA0_CICIN|nr:hypothetical protein L2E82_40793 [Cichorium intybus]